MQTTMRNSRLSRLALNDQGFAFDPAAGDAFLLNSSALSVVRGCQAGKTETELAECLAEEFQIPLDTATRNVSDFVTRLKAMRLV
jgi:PqqD family protein of HPr-rel-A system